MYFAGGNSVFFNHGERTSPRLAKMWDRTIPPMAGRGILKSGILGFKLACRRTGKLPFIMFYQEGKLKKKVVPLFTSLSAQIRPPCLVMIRRTVVRPTPVPENSSSVCKR